MAATHVALLRGVNIGRSKRVPMAELRALLEELGHRDVRTLLNSGNAVFATRRASTARLAAEIRAGIAGRLGVDTAVTVLAAAELHLIIDENPLRDIASDPSRLLIAVTPGAQDLERLAPLLGDDWAPEAIAIGSRAAYLWLPDGIIDSRLQTALSRVLRDAVTARNWSTMTKLAQLLD